MFSFGLLAQMIGKKMNVTVTSEGDNACTFVDADGAYKINVPAVSSIDSDVLMGYLYHEIAHVKYTDFNLLKTIINDEVLRSLQNIFEDNFVERALAKSYPGTQHDFLATARAVFVDGHKRNSDDIAECAMQYVFQGVRNISQEETGPVLPDMLRSDLDAVIARAGSTESTSECIDLAKQVYEIIKPWLSQQSQGSTSEQQDTSDDTDEGQQQGTSDSTDEGQQSSQPQGKSLKDLCKSFSLGDQMRDKLAEDAAGNDRHNAPAHVDVCGIGGATSMLRNGIMGKLSRLRDDHRYRAMAAASKLATQLYAAMQAYSMEYETSQRRGRVDPRRLYRLPMRSDRVFQRRVVQAKVNTHVSIILDGSGSMDGRRADEASFAGYAIMRAMRQIPGVTAEQWVFFDNNLVPMCKVQENPDIAPMYIADTYGGTELGAIFSAYLGHMRLDDPLKKQVLIFVTDGRMDDEQVFETTLGLADRFDVHTYGVGISVSLPDCMRPEQCCMIKQVEDLPEAFFGILHRELLC